MKNRIYGYARVSTEHQSLERQIRNIDNYCISKYGKTPYEIYKDKYTGTKLDRPSFNSLLSKVKAGDTIIFDSVSRMSRTADDGFKLYSKLFEQGVELVFLNEQSISTEVYKDSMQSVDMTNTDVDIILEALNKYLLRLAENQIRIAFEQAEKEVQDLRERTKQGMETARENGKKIGRTKGDKLVSHIAERCKAIILEHHKDFNGTLNNNDCIKLCECSRNSFFKYKRELTELNK